MIGSYFEADGKIWKVVERSHDDRLVCQKGNESSVFTQEYIEAMLALAQMKATKSGKIIISPKKEVSIPRVLVWTWDGAPLEYKVLSKHSNREEWWVVFIPKEGDGYCLPGELSKLYCEPEDNCFIKGWGYPDVHERPEGLVVIFAYK